MSSIVLNGCMVLVQHVNIITYIYCRFDLIFNIKFECVECALSDHIYCGLENKKKILFKAIPESSLSTLMQIKSLFQSLCLFQRRVLLTDKVAPIMTSGQELAWQFQNCVYRE